jgi:D-glycero-D-manno-heptose 1,7-bisphosphate phosphatase
VTRPSGSAAPVGGRVRSGQTVFLDRDGTINVKAPPGQYVTSSAALVLIPGSAAAIARLNAAGVRVVLVTNQRWLSGPAADPAGYARVHARLEELLAAAGAHLDAAYYCPHDRGRCDCRKPGTGMLTRAAREHRFSLAAAVMIGDSETDVAAGQAAGTATILLRPGRQPMPGGAGLGDAGSGDADFVADDLAGAVQLILSDRAGSYPR